MKFTLTKQQTEHLDSVKWLLSPACRTGKTFLIAYAALELAAKHPNQNIFIFDHLLKTKESIVRTINIIYHQNYSDEYTIWFNKTDSCFKLLLRDKK